MLMPSLCQLLIMHFKFDKILVNNIKTKMVYTILSIIFLFTADMGAGQRSLKNEVDLQNDFKNISNSPYARPVPSPTVPVKLGISFFPEQVRHFKPYITINVHFSLL